MASYGNYGSYGGGPYGGGSYSTTTSYSYSSTTPQKSTTTVSYSDPFSKSTSAFGGSFGGLPGVTSGFGATSTGGYGAPTSGFGGFGGSTGGYGGSTGGYGGSTGGYGGSTGGYGGSTGGYGGSTGGYGGSTAGFGSFAKPSQPTPSFGTTSYSTPGASTGFGGAAPTPSYGSTTNYGAPSGPSFGTPAKPSVAGPSVPSGTPITGPSAAYQSTTQDPKNPAAHLPVAGSAEMSELSRAGKQLFANAFSESATKSGYKDLLRQLQASNQKYKDLDFPPELRSLTGGLSDRELAESGNPLNWKGLIWLRAEEIYGKGNFQIFTGKIEPNDINQGALGDCYFLSTLASLAEWPKRITKLFETDQPNEQGCYGVKICDTGIWQTIILDDYIPCTAKAREPCFTRGNGNEIWVQLLEKAWAKVYGSYARIEAGLTRECLHDLTGAPTKYYLTGDESKFDEIWEAISSGEKKDFIMTCGAGDFFEGADLMSSIGLVGSHAYSLLSAITVRDRYGKEVRLVKLRNPWGQGEWTGDWSDKSPTWTEDLKRQVGLVDKDDGAFFMSFDDLMKYFSDIQICKIHDDFVYNAVKATCDSRRACYFKFNVTESGHYYVTVNQESKRKHAESENYQYSDVYLVMGKKVGNGYEYIEGYQKADKEVWTDGHLDAGEYIVYAKIAWNDHKPKDFALSVYGKGGVKIEQVQKSYCADFLEKVYMHKGRKAKKFEDYKHCGVNNCYRAVELTDDGFGFVYYKNESGKTLEEELYFKYLEGLKFRKPFRGNTFKISVPPGQERIVVTKVIPRAERIRQAFTEKARFI